MRSLVAIARFATPLAVTVMLAACRGASQARLSCPPGDTLMGAAPPKGEELWCQKLVGGKPVKDGLFIVYEAGGKSKMLQGSYRNGLQDGEWTMWYETGQRASVDHYRNGLQDGPHSSWYANGAMAQTGQYRGGKRIGVWTTWDPSGMTSRKQDYNLKSPADAKTPRWGSARCAKGSQNLLAEPNLLRPPRDVLR